MIVLVKLPEIKFCCDPWAAPPLYPVPVGASQVYLVPAGTRPSVGYTGDTWKVTPAHTVVDKGEISAFGFIVTTNVNGLPFPQSAVLGMIV